MKLQDIIEAEFADLIHNYNDVELESFNYGELIIKTNNKDFIKDLLKLDKPFKCDIINSNTIVCY